MSSTDLNTDQMKVITALNSQNLWITGESEEENLVGLPYKEILTETSLSKEKVLLSLGFLEARGLVKHNVAIQRTFLDYLGHCNVEIAGQKVLRIFYLTEKGREIANKIAGRL